MHRRLSFGARFLGVSLVLAVASCTSTKSGDTNGSGEGGATGGDARTNFITQYCSIIAPCCTEVGSSDTGCNGNNTALSAVTPSSFDSAAGDACLALLRASTSAPDFCSTKALLGTNRECSSLATRGTTPVGGNCNDATSGTECAPSPDGQTSCVYGQGGKQICQVQSLANAGDACDDDSLADGALPFGASLDGPVNEKGAYCDRSKGLYCKNGTCAAAATLGQPCDTVTVTQDACVPGLYCGQAANSVCQTPVADGMACQTDDICASNDGCSGGKCGLAPFTVSNLQNVCGP
jgi:hypothetical protein